MAVIGTSRFLDKIECLPGEDIVWEGGASMRGMVAQLLPIVLLAGLLAGSLWGVQHLETLLLKDNPAYEQARQEANPDGSAEQTGQQPAEPTAGQPALPPPKLLNQPLLTILTATAIFFLVAGTVITAWLKIRNYWFVITSERICIQSGILGRQVATIDIDKVVSVVITHSVWDRLLGTHAIEVVHPGITINPRNAWKIFNPYVIQYVPVSNSISSELLNNWLPRDNPHNRTA